MMDEKIKRAFEDSKAKDKEVNYMAYQTILEATDGQVDWAYEVWDQQVADLTNKDNHQRSRAAQYLANLAAYSDPEKRILQDFSKLWQVTYDEKFVTARHCLQSIWKVGLAGPEQLELLLAHMTDRFQNGTAEKNYTLIRSDILQGMRNLYDLLEEEEIRQRALALVDGVEEEKYRKKYAKIWK